MPGEIYGARAALHMWEEPCISGCKGSGAVFFTGCGLRCCFCQNREIAIGKDGCEIDVKRLAEIFLELQDKGLINEDVLTATSDNCVQDFVNGKAAMFSNGMWVISSLLEANPDMADKIGFAPYPAYMPDSKPVY